MFDRRRSVVRPFAGLAAAALFAALPACSPVPPSGTPMVRAMPDDDGPVTVGADEDGVIVVFERGDRIGLRFDVRGSIGHVENDDPDGGAELVVDRGFWVWSGPRGASISFDEGGTWAPAGRALDGSFDVSWERTPEGVSEITLGITAEPG